LNRKSDVEIKAERKAKRFYIGLVLLLFAIQASILGTAIRLAIGDPALAVVPDYHQAALQWDDAQAAKQASAKMGWDISLQVSDVADGAGKRAIEFFAVNQDGEPVANLQVRARVYRHARADQVQRIELENVGEGRYMAMPSMAAAGLWQVELDVQNAGQPMTLTRTLELES